jgi:hypothetical protein
MKEQKENEFEALREKLSGFRVDPPKEVWNAISGNLGGGGRRRNLIILMATAASVALALSVGLSLRHADRSIRQEMTAVEEGQDPSNRLPAKEEPAVQNPEPEVISEDRPLEEAPESHPERSLAAAVAEEVKIAVISQEEPVDGYAEEPEDLIDAQENIFRPQSIAVEQLATAYIPEVPDREEPVTLEMEKDEASLIPVDTDNEIIGTIPEDFGKSNEKRWIISGVVSPLYSYRDASGDQEISSGVNDIESGMLAYAGGINVGYRPGSRLTIESGLIYNKMGINLGEVAGFEGSRGMLVFDPITSERFTGNVVTVANSIGNIVSNRGDIFINKYKKPLSSTNEEFSNWENDIDAAITFDELKQNLAYLEIPFNVRYSVIDRDIEVQLIGGISTNFLVNNSVMAITDNGPEEIGSISNLNHVNYSGNAGMGMIYHFHSRFSISLEPRFRYFLNSINDNTLPVTRPYAIGLYTGINYRF